MPPATVIPFYALRLRHLVLPKAKLHAECIGCGRRGVLSVLEAAFKHGPEANVRDLEKVLRCRGCGKAGLVNVTVRWL